MSNSSSNQSHPFQDKKKEEWSSNDWADYWYYEVGVNGVPYNGEQKNTWVQWKNHPKGDFTKVSIPLEVFNAWKKADSFSNGIATVCGKVFRGEHIGKWLNGIDLDNKLGIEKLFPSIMSGDIETRRTLKQIAEKNLVEQHNNKEKCHVYFYTKNRPILSKIANSDHYDGKDPKIPTRPQIEIKSGGSAIMNCTPSPHKDGSKLQILGTTKIITVDADTLENQVNEICIKYKIPYLFKDGQKDFQLDLPSVQNIIDSKGKMYAGENRQIALLRYLDSKKIKNPELEFDSMLTLADQFTKDHFAEQYPQSKVAQIVKDAYKFGTNILIEKIKENEEPDDNHRLLESDAIELEQLNDINNPKYADKLVKVKAIVSSNSIPYNIPSEIECSCSQNSDKHDDEVHNENFPIEKKIKIPEKKYPEFVEITSINRFKILSAYAKGCYPDACKPTSIEIKSITINKMKIRPIMPSLVSSNGKEFLDDKGNKYISYDIFVIQKGVDENLTAGKEIEIIGYVIADPKSGKITLMVLHIKELNENNYNLEKIKEIQKFHKDKPPNEIIDWWCMEFEKFSKIVKRKSITIVGLFTMFSSLGFDFEDKVVRGWVNSLIIGDSTTGKSESIRRLIILLQSGQIISGEMATLAGIAGASVQTSGGQWWTDYGLLPLQDRKALWIDGAHKLGRDEIDRLAEAERSGKIEINKASKGTAWARTRQGRIMNPLDDERHDTTTMNNFMYPVQALTNSFQLQSIARIDLATFVADDVSGADRNTKMNEKHNPILENYSELLKMIWSNDCEIRLEDDVIDRILEGANELEDKFKTDEIPLITNDQKYKLAKLDVSLAGLTCSFNEEYTEIIVKKEHVEYIIKFINSEYSDIGLLNIKKQGTFGEINIKVLHEIVEKINDKTKNDDPNYEASLEIIKWLAIRRRFNKEDLKEDFNLSRDSQLQPLLSYLLNENLTKQSKLGIIATKKSTALAKFIIRDSKKIVKNLHDEHNHLIKTFECKGCNTTWKNTRDTLQETQNTHSCVHGSDIIEINDT